MRQKTVITKLLQSVTEVYYKVCQVLQSASGITKCDRLLLQSASGITKCDSYYKVRRNSFQRRTKLFALIMAIGSEAVVQRCSVKKCS